MFAVSWQEALVIAAIVLLSLLAYARRPRGPSGPRWSRVCKTCLQHNAARAKVCDRCGGRLDLRDMVRRA